MAMNGFKRILLPVDFTEHSEMAAAYALRLARQDGSTIHAVHVVNINDDITQLAPTAEFEKKASRKVAALLKDFVAARLEGCDKVQTQILSGVPHREILAYAKSAKCDLVVMGSYGKGGMDRFLVGSTTERVMRKATCPVLVIPPTKR